MNSGTLSGLLDHTQGNGDATFQSHRPTFSMPVAPTILPSSQPNTRRPQAFKQKRLGTEISKCDENGQDNELAELFRQLLSRNVNFKERSARTSTL